MNRASIDRSAYLARLAGSVLIAVGLLMAVSWVWAQVRTQQNLDGSVYGRLIVTSLGSTDGRPTWALRIDVFTSSVSALWQPALALAGGFGLRMLADYTQSRVGGSITGFVEGDVLDVSLFPDGDPAVEESDDGVR